MVFIKNFKISRTRVEDRGGLVLYKLLNSMK